MTGLLGARPLLSAPERPRRGRSDRAQRRIVRLATSRRAESTAQGERVIRLDGRTRIIGVKRGTVWTPLRRPIRLDRKAVRRLQGDQVNAMLCRRRLRYARVTLSWLLP